MGGGRQETNEGLGRVSPSRQDTKESVNLSQHEANERFHKVSLEAQRQTARSEKTSDDDAMYRYIKTQDKRHDSSDDAIYLDFWDVMLE